MSGDCERSVTTMSVRPVRSQSSCGLPVLFWKYRTATDGLPLEASGGGGGGARRVHSSTAMATTTTAAAAHKSRDRPDPRAWDAGGTAVVVMGRALDGPSTCRLALRRSTTRSRAV